MDLQFQSTENPELKSVNVSHEYTNDKDAAIAFLCSLSHGNTFLTEICKLTILSASRMENENGYMKFTARADYYDATGCNVEGKVYFKVIRW